MGAKVKFNIGDKVVIAKFPMGMLSGSSDTIRPWFKEKRVFTVKGDVRGQTFNKLGWMPCVYVEEEGWYFDAKSLAFAKGYKKPKQLRSWVLK